MCKGCHIHVHGEDSVLDGLNKIRDLVLKAKSLGHTAIGLTDHGVCAGIPDLIKFANEEGIKPLPGVELYITKDHLFGSEQMAELKEEIMSKYGLEKKKIFDAYVRFLHKQNYQFDRPEVIAATNEILGEALIHGIKSRSNDGEFLMFADIELESEDSILKQWKQDMYRMMDVRSYHLVVIAKNNKGLADLYEIVSEAHLNGFYGDPRISLEWIQENNLGDDLIATSACLGSYSSQLLMAGRQDEAVQHLKECQETFGHFYLEKQATFIPEQQFINACMDSLSPILNIKKVLTTDVHYANKEDNTIHDIAVTAGIGKCINDPDRMQYAHEFWMKSDEEMLAQCFDEEAWANTMEIADMVNVTLQAEPLFPKFDVPENTTASELLRSKAWKGLFEFCLRHQLEFNEYSDRLAYELDVICNEGFADYFLVVEDFVRATREAGYLVGAGRGSAAGSLVCGALKITRLDPIKSDLLFERFLNPDRIGLPDIDIDFSYEASQFVYQYLQKKYGYDRVAQIGTKGTLAARVVCRKVGKTLGYELSIQDAFAKCIPERPGIKLLEAYEESEAVKSYANQYPDWWSAMLSLEGHVTSVGVHAAGVVLSPVKVSRVVPLRRDKQGKPTTQFDMKWIEHFLVKFDILKLDTLDLIKQTMINAGIEDRDIYEIPMDDEYVFEKIYKAGDLSGVFQCESPLYKKIIADMKPDKFDDINTIVALGRPGPLDLIPGYINRKFGREEIKYPYSSLEPILKDTYATWVYQEQLMKASQVIGGFTLSQADFLRKAIAKKIPELTEEWIGNMIYGNEKLNIPGGINLGYDEQGLLKIKSEWLAFANYCFNKSHSEAYATISYQTAWLKAYYPVEFWAALLTLSEDKKDGDTTKNSAYMREIKERGISIMPPTIAVPSTTWTGTTFAEPVIDSQTGKPHIGNIYASLSGIASVTTETVEEIKMMDTKNLSSFGHFLDIFEAHRKYCKESGIRSRLNKKVMINLIKAGVFDHLNNNRNKLIRDFLVFDGKEKEAAEYPLKTTKIDIMQYEKEVLGAMFTFESRWEKMKDDEEGQFTGFVEKTEQWEARTGKKHWYVYLNTGAETIQVTVWGGNYDRNPQLFVVGNKLTIFGKKGYGRLTADRVTLKEEAAQQPVLV